MFSIWIQNFNATICCRKTRTQAKQFLQTKPTNHFNRFVIWSFCSSKKVLNRNKFDEEGKRNRKFTTTISIFFLLRIENVNILISHYLFISVSENDGPNIASLNNTMVTRAPWLNNIITIFPIPTFSTPLIIIYHLSQMNALSVFFAIS